MTPKDRRWSYFTDELAEAEGTTSLALLAPGSTSHTELSVWSTSLQKTEFIHLKSGWPIQMRVRDLVRNGEGTGSGSFTHRPGSHCLRC